MSIAFGILMLILSNLVLDREESPEWYFACFYFAIGSIAGGIVDRLL